MKFWKNLCYWLIFSSKPLSCSDSDLNLFLSNSFSSLNQSIPTLLSDRYRRKMKQKLQNWCQYGSELNWVTTMLVFVFEKVQKTVVTTKSVEYMPFLLSFILFINGLTWTVYAVLTRDWFIGVSSHPQIFP